MVLGLGFVIAPGLSSLSNVQAQGGWNGRRDQQRNDRDRRNDESDRRGQYDRNRNGVDDRYENNRNVNVDRNRNGVDDRYENNRNGSIDRNRNGVNDRYENNGRYGRNDGYYGNDGNRGYGYNSAEEQKGYRDGLDRGQKDARTNRRADPNNSSHYQKGSQAYREGFRRGFFEGYRQYSNRRW